MFSRSWLKPWQITQGHHCEFHLLLLCLYNVVFFTQEKPHVPPTHAAILSPLTLLLSPLSPLTDKCTYTHAKKSECVHRHYTHIHRHTQVLTNHLQQICWWLCTQIRLPVSDLWGTKWSCYHCSSLQYPAPKADERSMIYQSVSVVLARGWFTNTKHTARRKELHLQVWSDAAAWM